MTAALHLFDPAAPADEAALLRRQLADTGTRLDAALARVAELEAENARLRLRGRQKDPRRFALGAQIDQWRRAGWKWLRISYALKRLTGEKTPRPLSTLGTIRRDYLRENESRAVGRAAAGATMKEQPAARTA
jgi:hypothetical protein